MTCVSKHCVCYLLSFACMLAFVLLIAISHVQHSVLFGAEISTDMYWNTSRSLIMDNSHYKLHTWNKSQDVHPLSDTDEHKNFSGRVMGMLKLYAETNGLKTGKWNTFVTYYVTY